MRILPEEAGILHFIGIGGIGMSGIAEVLHAKGYSVRGSDIAESANVQRLRAQGIEVYIGHQAKNVECASLVVISSAVKMDNPELEAARENHLPIVRRAEMLGEIMRLKKSIVVAGTHGKTTTTSLVAAMLEEGKIDPTVINGGIVNRYGTNTRMGQGEWMVAEGDESDGSFLHLPATVAVVTNIDPEHMEHYGDFDAVRAAYRHFVQNVPFYGYAVLCSDHPEVQAMIPDLPDRRIVTYGLNHQADVRASNIRTDAQGSVFDVTFAGWLREGKETILRDVALPMMGQHNVLNSLAALAIAYRMDIAAPLMKKALAQFAGVKRRFTRTGTINGVTVIDDYGHHPVEIDAVLKAARPAVDATGGRVIAVVQPHRYSRLSSLFDEFCTCFHEADMVVVADVYPAGEKPMAGFSKETLAAGIEKNGHKDVHMLSNAADLPRLIAAHAKEGDFVICLGAGDITKWAHALPADLEKAFGAQKKQRA